MKKYTVENVYGIAGETEHKSVKAAATACRKREGEGWIIKDADGNQVDFVDGQEIVIRAAG